MEDATCLICLELSALAAEMPGHNEARVVNEWQSTRSGRDTMAQTEKAVSACDRARRPLVSRARHLQY